MTAQDQSSATLDEETKRRLEENAPPPPKNEDSLYAYQRIYNRAVKGTFRNIRTIIDILLMVVYFGGPWLRWDRGPTAPDQAIFIDLPGRKAYFFWIEIWPQEVYYLTGLLVIAAVVLFFSTSLFGRVWCGFACFQTVFTDIFMWVERKIEGDRNKRIRLDRSKWTAEKLTKKAAKNIVWLIMGFLVGANFALYFGDAPSMVGDLASGHITNAMIGTIAIVGGFCYLLAGYAREQVCIYMCPYARFQSAMLDEDSMIVTYEAWRGEPRAMGKVGQSFEGRGHCVDCNACVQVCPTGVDIRNGNQLACIGCGLCIDACNTVMDRYGLPRGLVTYDSVTNQVARSKGESHRVKLLRPRTYAYTVLLALVSGIMIFSLSTRATIDLNVIHDRSPLFVLMDGGEIRNAFTMKIINKEKAEHTFRIATAGIEGMQTNVLDFGKQWTDYVDVTVKPDSVGVFRVFVKAPKTKLDGQQTRFDFNVTNLTTEETAINDVLFAAP